MTAPPEHPRLPPPSTDRLQLARNPTSIDADPNLYHSLLLSKHQTQQPLSDPNLEDDKNPEKTVLYLAYGSNLSIEKFRGDRGIEPLSQTNVYAPALRLTFDLVGVPYLEPCFSGTNYRTADVDANYNGERYRDIIDEKGGIEESDLEAGHNNNQGHGYHKEQWRKPLIGVVYEVTLTDYAHIIATEGGGNGYVDIVTDCFPFPGDMDYNPNDPTPHIPAGKPFMAHTLLSPPKSSFRPNSHLIRPDPSYAQPSARYLKLITDGAEELNFPYDYRAYLASIRPYKATTSGQKVGEKIALYILIPLFQVFIALGQLLADDNGIIPGWLARVFNVMRELMWMVYDVVVVKVLGDGERSVNDI
ncbi:hypothetical protein EYB26_004933 [Talaromyces marneffei]|uniref:gamma-glutamylcyclotransferase n=1 Tax=Talaromyces marneffei PM1 TaxID=1077442 RepID=A0A093Y2H4_TALMA|nr:uncharacterized protein EYB26_004933 [Talaromyces marneffei]QGA17263.1 hypothetical protein EYB26_004933 [Talaromyces marneffei]